MEEKPPGYEGRERDTKGIAQRIALDYLKRPALLINGRRKLAWLLVALSVAAAIPIVMGLPSGHRALLSGAVSPSHALFVDRCEACHSMAFARVPDQACKTCHDGAPHPAKSIDTAKPSEPAACAGCHVEHRGSTPLANVANGNCTRCHSDLQAHATGVTLASFSITAFRPQKHPEFSPLSKPDSRPIRLNHAAHMPAKPRVIGGMKLPMQCTDCHRTDPASATGEPLPVTFEQDCRSCHARELEFDVYELLSPSAAPAPHTKDPRSIHQFIVDAYRQVMAADPSIVRRRLGNEIEPPANAAAWLDKVVRDSEGFLFQRKCTYCHESVSLDQGFPVVPKVNEIRGRYVESKPQGEPWLPRGEFSHRAHRAVECESCHVKARDSARTADVLIPAMESCLPCHEGGSAGLDRCSTCHLYHNRSLEQDHRRPTERVLTGNAGGGIK